MSSRILKTRLNALFIMMASALIVSAFAPALILGSEQTVSVESSRSEASAPAVFMRNGPTDPEEFEAFLDPLVTDLMNTNHIPGGAITVVKDGQIFFAKGYGYADLERSTPATADTTIFRTGSVSKVFTWTAVMQLVEQGKLDLNTDVNTYLTHFQVPTTFGQPITLAQLMTHTAGFEDEFASGAIYASADSYEPLEKFLAENIPARIFPPGKVVAYSNYGTALAGEIVAEVSGEPFEQYVANHILGPLGMNHSTFMQPLPSGMLPDAAVGYDIDEKGLPHAGSFEFLQVRPAAALSATATDMARFLIAHLQDGQSGGGHILQPASAQDMRKQYYAFNPQLPGMTRGFVEAYRNDIHFVLHLGTTELSSSLLALLPEQNIGIFLTFNSNISAPARLSLVHALLDRYYPAPTLPAVNPPSDFSERATSFTGSYLTTRRAETNLDKMFSPLYLVSVRSNPEGTLTIDAFRDKKGVPIHWVEVAPLVFQEVGGQSLLAFSTDAQDQVTAMYSGDQPIHVFQRLAWYENPMVHVAGLGMTLLIFITTLLIWPFAGLLRLVRHGSGSLTPLERWGRYLASGLILVNLVIVGFIVSVLVGDASAMQLGYPTGFTVAGILALVSGAGAVALLMCVVRAWRERAWGTVGRLHYTLVTIAAMYFLWYLIDINVLRWPLA
ncbi:MAG TPA: serine hydrolase domain-containing protein [Anaerolineales bacterium]|nr:serine hydrolase domain-containing protein [Anaerolineales bacterium]